MPRLIRLAVATAAVTALGAAPASAQSPPDVPCDNLPTCVNYTFSTVDRTLDWLEGHPDGSVIDDVMCLAYEVGTGQPCPTG